MNMLKNRLNILAVATLLSCSSFFYGAEEESKSAVADPIASVELLPAVHILHWQDGPVVCSGQSSRTFLTRYDQNNLAPSDSVDVSQGFEPRQASLYPRINLHPSNPAMAAFITYELDHHSWKATHFNLFDTLPTLETSFTYSDPDKTLSNFQFNPVNDSLYLTIDGQVACVCKEYGLTQRDAAEGTWQMQEYDGDAFYFEKFRVMSQLNALVGTKWTEGTSQNPITTLSVVSLETQEEKANIKLSNKVSCLSCSHLSCSQNEKSIALATRDGFVILYAQNLTCKTTLQKKYAMHIYSINDLQFGPESKLYITKEKWKEGVSAVHEWDLRTETQVSTIQLPKLTRSVIVNSESQKVYGITERSTPKRTALLQAWALQQ